MSRELRAGLFLVLASSSASLALGGLVGLFSSYEDAMERAQAEPDRVAVWVANKDLYPGIAIASSDLYAVHVPAPVIPDGAFLSPDAVVGRIPRERILANDVVRSQRLFDPESGQGLNAVIPRGMRAVSVNIEDGQALQGLLHPGSYVDVLFTGRPEDRPEARSEARPEARSRKVETTTLFQAVFVLAVDSRMSGESRDDALARGPQRPSVTLLVDPVQAERIAHAKQAGELRLTLRHGDDIGVVDLTPKGYGPSARPRDPAPRVDEAPLCQPVARVEGERKWTQLVHPDGTPCEE